MLAVVMLCFATVNVNSIPALADPPMGCPPELVWDGSYGINTQADLDTLSGYTAITGNLSIVDTSLTSLEGLECLNHVGGNLYIDNNDSLTNLEGLNNLTSVGGLYIRYNDSLTSLEGLNNLTSVGGSLYIVFNDSLTSLEGLSRLCFIGQNFKIEENHELCTSSAEALRDQVLNCDGIGGDINISGNKDCIDIDDILTFFDEHAWNDLQGRGTGWLAKLRLFFMRSMLVIAGELIERDLTEAACFTLQRAYLSCDDEFPPPDFDEEEATEGLANMIQELRTSMGCDD